MLWYIGSLRTPNAGTVYFSVQNPQPRYLFLVTGQRDILLCSELRILTNKAWRRQVHMNL